MKRTIWILAGLATASTLAIHYMAKSSTQDAPAAASQVASTESGADLATANSPKTKPERAVPDGLRPKAASGNPATDAPAPSSTEAIAFSAAIDTLTSLHSTYAEMQAAWKQLQASGRLADAAAELERRAAGDPENAMCQSALGQAYLKLCADTTDVRQQAIWAMTADADFEKALNLDPSNWDARFTRAVAMSYWPANLNKGDEVIQQLNTLVAQQEQQSPQPQFAQTYEWLGKQYQKTGQPDAAQQIWQRGASLFPSDQSLQTLMAAAPAPQP
jgi:tetratricopeptide (TPR) repeat protein